MYMPMHDAQERREYQEVQYNVYYNINKHKQLCLERVIQGDISNELSSQSMHGSL